MCMSRRETVYSVCGYRYAPESFHAYKEFPGQKQTEVALSFDQRQHMGYLYLTEGGRAAIDYVKRIERMREQKSQLYRTYGFILKDNPRAYVYNPHLYFAENATLAERLCILRQIRGYLVQEGHVIQCAECDLDENYRPVNIRNHYVVADLSRPIVVRLKVQKREQPE